MARAGVPGVVPVAPAVVVSASKTEGAWVGAWKIAPGAAL